MWPPQSDRAAVPQPSGRTHQSEERRDRSAALRMHERQQRRQLALLGADEEQPRRREDDAVDAAEGRERDEHGHAPGHHAECLLTERLGEGAQSHVGYRI